MIELHLLSPEDSTLLLVSKQGLPRRSREQEHLRKRLPFAVGGCTIRRAHRSLPGDKQRRIPFLVVRPGGPTRRGPTRSHRLFLHPLLFSLLLRRSHPSLCVDWGSQQLPALPVELQRGPGNPAANAPPGRRSQTVRPATLLALARRRRVRLLLFLLAHIRLLPVLLLRERRGRQILPVFALLSALLLPLSALIDPARPRPSPPTAEPGAIVLPAPDPTLSALTELLSLLIERPGGIAIEEIEGTERALLLSVQVTDMESVAKMVREAYPEAQLEIESADWLLAEAAGRIFLTLPVQ